MKPNNAEQLGVGLGVLIVGKLGSITFLPWEQAFFLLELSLFFCLCIPLLVLLLSP